MGPAAARGAAITVGGQWIRFAIQLISVVILARLITPADYGLFAMTVAITGFAALFGDFGLSMAAIQAQTLSPKQKSNLLWVNVVLGLLVSALVWLLAYPISSFYSEPRLVPVVQVLSITFLIGACAAQFRSEVSRKFKFVWLAISDTSAQLIGLPVAVAMALMGYGYWALVAQQIALVTVPLVVLIVGARWVPGLPSRAPMRDLLRFGGDTLATQVVAYVSANSDSVLLGRVWGPDAVGVYNRAYQLLLLPLQQIASPMTRVALPILSRLMDQPVKYQNYVERAQLVLVYVLGGAFISAAAMADPLIDIVLGPAWGESKVLFQILVFGGIFQALSYLYYWIFLSKAMTGLQLRFSLASRTLMVALIALGLPWGAVGVAIGASVGLAVNWLILSFAAIPRTGVKISGIIVASVPPLILYASFAVVLLPLSFLISSWDSPFLRLGALVGAELLLTGMALVLSPRTRHDLRVLTRTALLMRRRNLSSD